MMMIRLTGNVLIEFLLVFIILVILLTNTSTFTVTQKLYWTHSIDSIYHALQQARLKSLIENKTTEICPSNDTHHCVAHWENGKYIIFKINKKTYNIIPIKLLTVYWKASLNNTQKILFSTFGTTNGEQGSLIFTNKNKIFARIIIDYNANITKIAT